ncbi:MAG: hypothetical protein IPM55_02190 [Acidobacteria bacterium]|nr:hypothetical protein [Acidobacteriota bacterium]
MGFIIRGVVILIIFAFVVYVFKAIARLTHHMRGTVRDVRTLRDQIAGRGTVNEEMVRCVNCGAFVASRDALTVSARNSSRTFCSQECVSARVQNR